MISIRKQSQAHLAVMRKQSSLLYLRHGSFYRSATSAFLFVMVIVSFFSVKRVILVGCFSINVLAYTSHWLPQISCYFRAVRQCFLEVDACDGSNAFLLEKSKKRQFCVRRCQAEWDVYCLPVREGQEEDGETCLYSVSQREVTLVLLPGSKSISKRNSDWSACVMCLPWW